MGIRLVKIEWRRLDRQRKRTGKRASQKTSSIPFSFLSFNYTIRIDYYLYDYDYQATVFVEFAGGISMKQIQGFMIQLRISGKPTLATEQIYLCLRFSGSEKHFKYRYKYLLKIALLDKG